MPAPYVTCPFPLFHHTPSVPAPALAEEFDRVGQNAASWHAFDPNSKTELHSAALIRNGGVIVIDPIALTPDALAELTRSARVQGVIITNANHHRAAASWSDQFDVPIFAHPTSFDSHSAPPRFEQIQVGDLLFDSIEVIAIEGAAPGEIVLYSEGTLIVGDCLINFEPYGFTLLPSKYCSDQKLMKHSLRQLLDRDVTRILFAHGTPLLTQAAARLKALLS